MSSNLSRTQSGTGGLRQGDALRDSLSRPTITSSWTTEQAATSFGVTFGAAPRGEGTVIRSVQGTNSRHRQLRPGLRLVAMATGSAAEMGPSDGPGESKSVDGMRHAACSSLLDETRRNGPFPIDLTFVDDGVSPAAGNATSGGMERTTTARARDRADSIDEEQGEWSKEWDDAQSKNYWYNHRTQESQWHVPTAAQLAEAKRQKAVIAAERGEPAPLEPEPEPEPAPDLTQYQKLLKQVEIQKWDKWTSKDGGKAYVVWTINIVPQNHQPLTLQKRFTDVETFHDTLMKDPHNFRLPPEWQFQGKLPPKWWVKSAFDEGKLAERKKLLEQYFATLLDWDQRMRSPDFQSRTLSARTSLGSTATQKGMVPPALQWKPVLELLEVEKWALKPELVRQGGDAGSDTSSSDGSGSDAGPRGVTFAAHDIEAPAEDEGGSAWDDGGADLTRQGAHPSEEPELQQLDRTNSGRWPDGSGGRGSGSQEPFGAPEPAPAPAPEPEPEPDPYTVGAAVEVYSNSQSRWLPATVKQRAAQNVKVSYTSDGRAIEKTLPHDSANLRLPEPLTQQSPRPSPEDELCPGWKQVTDAQTGVLYYQNQHWLGARSAEHKPVRISKTQLEQWQNESDFKYEVKTIVRHPYEPQSSAVGCIDFGGALVQFEQQDQKWVIKTIGDGIEQATRCTRGTGAMLCEGMILDRVALHQPGSLGPWMCWDQQIGSRDWGCTEAMSQLQQHLRTHPVTLTLRHPWQREIGGLTTIYKHSDGRVRDEQPAELGPVLEWMQAWDMKRYPNMRQAPLSSTATPEQQQQFYLQQQRQQELLEQAKKDAVENQRRAEKLEKQLAAELQYREKEELSNGEHTAVLRNTTQGDEVEVTIVGLKKRLTAQSETTKGMRVNKATNVSAVGTIIRKEGANIQVNFSESGGVAAEWVRCSDLAAVGKVGVRLTDTQGLPVRVKEIQPGTPAKSLAEQPSRGRNLCVGASLIKVQHPKLSGAIHDTSNMTLKRVLDLMKPRPLKLTFLLPKEDTTYESLYWAEKEESKKCELCQRKYVYFSMYLKKELDKLDAGKFNVIKQRKDAIRLLTELTTNYPRFKYKDRFSSVRVPSPFTPEDIEQIVDEADNPDKDARNGQISCEELMRIMRVEFEEEGIDEKLKELKVSALRQIALDKRIDPETVEYEEDNYGKAGLIRLIDEERAENAVCATCRVHQEKWLAEDRQKQRKNICYKVSAVLGLGYLALLIIHRRGSARGHGTVVTAAPDAPIVTTGRSDDLVMWHACGGAPEIDVFTIEGYVLCVVMQFTFYVASEFTAARSRRLEAESNKRGYDTQLLPETCCARWVRISGAAVASASVAFGLVWLGSDMDGFALLTYGVLVPWAVCIAGVVVAVCWIMAVYLLVCVLNCTGIDHYLRTDTVDWSSLFATLVLSIPVGLGCDFAITPLSECDVQRWENLVTMACIVFLTHAHIWMSVTLVPRVIEAAPHYDSDDDHKQSADGKKTIWCGLLRASDPSDSAAQPDSEQLTSSEAMRKIWWGLGVLVFFSVPVTSAWACKVSGFSFGQTLAYGIVVPWALLGFGLLMAGILHGAVCGVIALFKSPAVDDDGPGTVTLRTCWKAQMNPDVPALEWWHRAAIAMIGLTLCGAKFVHDLFEYSPAEGSASTGVACLVLVFHLALWITGLVKTSPLHTDGDDEAFLGRLKKVIDGLKSRRTGFIYLASAGASSVAAFILTGYSLESIIVSGIFPALLLLLLAMLVDSLHSGAEENRQLAHKTVRAILEPRGQSLADRALMRWHKELCCSCCPRPDYSYGALDYDELSDDVERGSVAKMQPEPEPEPESLQHDLRRKFNAPRDVPVGARQTQTARSPQPLTLEPESPAPRPAPAPAPRPVSASLASPGSPDSIGSPSPMPVSTGRARPSGRRGGARPVARRVARPRDALSSGGSRGRGRGGRGSPSQRSPARRVRP